jgi:translocation and assembly module TamA
MLTPGDPVKVTEIRIDIMGDGRLDPLFQKIYDKPGIKIGNRFHHGKYEKLKGRFESAATAHGYFDAKFLLSRALVNENEKSAVIELVYDTGKRYVLGGINLTQDVLSDEFVRRYLNIQTGDYYDTDKLLELKNLYNASNYFAGTSIVPDLENKKDNQVDVNIDLERRKRREYSIGMGYSSDTDLRVLLGFEDRYLNRSGHFFNADVTASETKKEAEAVYTIPLKKPAYEFLKFSTGYQREETTTNFSRKKSIGSSYTYYQKSKWLQTYAINFEHEDSIIGDKPLMTTDLIIPSWTVSRIKADTTAYPLKGWSLMSRLSGSPSSLGSDFSFVQWDTRYKQIWGGDFGRFIFRSHFGYTETVDFDELPASVRYFAGGDLSVRGYDYESLGPTEKNAEGVDLVVGGKNLWVTSVEYDHPIGETNWVLATFYDHGNASNDLTFDFKRSAGFGVRWISPIGPVRIDIAKALDDKKTWALHVTMGPDL